LVADDDWVGPAYLERLLAAAAPGVVPVAAIANAPEGSLPADAVADYDNWYSERLARFEGQTIPAADLPGVLGVNAGKLLPLSQADGLRYDESLRSGEDLVFWLELFARLRFRLRLLRRDPAATYFRTVRAGSVSRQEPSFDFAVRQRFDCIAAARAVDRTPDQVATVARAMTNAQAEQMNDYLRRHPAEHPRVVDEARGRGLYDAPWPVINRGLAEHLAILYCFTPYLDTSGLVAARRLRERGLVTDVVSHALDDVRTLDPTSGVIAAEVLDSTKVLPGPANFTWWNSIRQFVERALGTVADLESAKGRPYRSVYSRAMAVNAHFAAAALKLRQPGLPWIAEISDPLLRNPLGQDRANDVGDDWLVHELRSALDSAGFPIPPDVVKLFAWAELVPYALADEIVFTNELQQEFMLSYCPGPGLVERVRAISRVSHHPTLPPAYYTMVEAEHELSGPDVVDIGYFGVFYASRGLTEVTEALQSLRLADRRHVRLHVFTDRHENLSHEVVRAGLADVIRVRPYLPYLEFLNLTTKLDVLLVNDAATATHHGINPYLPSKLSDYRGSGTPIWAIHEPGSMLARVETTYGSRLGDAEGARRTIEQMIRDHVTPAVALVQ
jgi:hypothetical protein